MPRPCKRSLLWQTIQWISKQDLRATVWCHAQALQVLADELDKLEDEDSMCEELLQAELEHMQTVDASGLPYETSFDQCMDIAVQASLKDLEDSEDQELPVGAAGHMVSSLAGFCHCA